MKINEDISKNLIKKISIEFNDALRVGLEESSLNNLLNSLIASSIS